MRTGAPGMGAAQVAGLIALGCMSVSMLVSWAVVVASVAVVLAAIFGGGAPMMMMEVM